MSNAHADPFDREEHRLDAERVRLLKDYDAGSEISQRYTAARIHFHIERRRDLEKRRDNWIKRERMNSPTRGNFFDYSNDDDF